MADSKKASVFIDLETLSKWDAAIILTLGITILKDEDLMKPGLTYDDMLQRSTEYKFNVKEQLALGRIFEKNVMEWWQTQGESAQKILRASDLDLSITQLFDCVEQFLRIHGLGWKEVRWFDRNGFDMVKLQHLFEVTLGRGHNPPWDYQEVWGIETFLKFNSPEASRYGFMAPKAFNDPQFVYHSASCDAALDTLRYYKVFQP